MNYEYISRKAGRGKGEDNILGDLEKSQYNRNEGAKGQSRRQQP